MTPLLDTLLADIMARRYGALSVSEAYQLCRSVVREHYENFPVASFFLPKRAQRALSAVYTFARIADDIADREDLDLTPAERLQILEEVEGALLHRKIPYPFLAAVFDAIEVYSIPEVLLQRLLVAFRYDVQFQPFETWEKLLWYCNHSAVPVGEIVLCIAGSYRSEILPSAAALCTALQYVNFWQDIPIDRQRKRCFIPLEVLSQVGATIDDFYKNRLTLEQQHHILRQVLEKTASLFAQAVPLHAQLEGRWKFFLGLIHRGGLRIFGKIRDAGPALFKGVRPYLHRIDFLRIFIDQIRAKAIPE